MLPIRQALQDLPVPGPEALLHSKRLCRLLGNEITAAGGAISFERYMDLALYAPGLGYYSAGARKFGAAGDFVTAPELSPLFSRCLAAQCAEVLAALAGGDILELGAGSGVLAADVLKELERLQRLPGRYLILEVSADLRERQRRMLAQQIPALLGKVEWLEHLPSTFTGVIIGNEMLDALPVCRFRRAQHGFDEFTVAVENQRFVSRLRPAPAELRAALTTLESSLPQALVEDYVSEICVRLPAFMYSLADLLTRGVLLLLDYGYPRLAYYHPDRYMGTLMCHYRQRAHDDAFLYPGLQDITAHVDFTAVAEAATAAGLELVGYNTQAHFLLALGIVDDVHGSTSAAGGRMPGAAQARDLHTAREVKLLTLPEEMGERFKAIAFSKRLDLELSGFSLQDLSYSL